MNRKMPPIVLMFSVLVLASLACQAVVSRAVGSGDAPTAPTGQKSPTQPAKTPQTGKQPTVQPAVGGSQEIRQWAVSATASSQYGESSWNAEQALGAPNVTDCGDNGLAWASENSSGLDWIELTYATPVIPTAINIYQSFNPSQVIQVDIIDTAGTTYTAWQGSPKHVSTCPDLMTIAFDEKQKMLIKKVVVTVDQSILGLGWNEIDAVELVGVGEAGQ